MKTANFLRKVEGLSMLQRPRYSPGLLLEDEDLTAGVEYTREITRLLFRSLFGCGVVCGLEVKATLKCKRTALHVEVGPGLGLDGAGNPLHVLKTQTLTYDPDCVPMPPSVWVVLCYTDKACRPKDVSCAGEDDSRPEHTRSRDGFVVKLYDGLPDCACACAEPELAAPGRRLGRCCHDDEEEEAARRVYAEWESGLVARLEQERIRMGLPATAVAELFVRPGGAALSGTIDLPRPSGPVAAPAPAPAPAPPVAPAAARPQLPDICKCYDDHNAGKCIPDCGCSCVVLAKIKTQPPDDGKDDDVAVDVDAKVRRWIRPLLTGYLECLEPKRPAPPEVTPLTVTCTPKTPSIAAGDMTSVQATVGGADGARLLFSWATNAPGSIITGFTEDATFKSASSGNPGQAAVRVVVTDDRGRRADATCSIGIVEIN